MDNDDVEITDNSPAYEMLSRKEVYETDATTIPKWNSGTLYAKGSIVKVKVYENKQNDGNFIGQDYYCFYKKIFNQSNTTENPGFSPMSGWKLLENEYSPYSAYEKDDIVYTQNGWGNDNDGSDEYKNYYQCNNFYLIEYSNTNMQNTQKIIQTITKQLPNIKLNQNQEGIENSLWWYTVLSFNSSNGGMNVIGSDSIWKQVKMDR